MSVSAPLPTIAAATHPPADQQPVSEPARPAKPQPAVTRQGQPSTGKSNKAELARSGRRKRDYGRWV